MTILSTTSSTSTVTSSLPATISSTFSPINTESTTVDSNLPPGCVVGNLDKRVCNLEDEDEINKSKIDVLTEENQELNLKIENLTSKFAETIGNLENKIEALANEKQELEENVRNQNKILIAALKELESRFFEIKGCSCDCRHN